MSEDYGLAGPALLGSGASFRPIVAGSFALVSLAPWRALVDVQPRCGAAAGGTELTAHGTAFDPDAWLFVGGKAASQVSIDDATTIRGTTPRLPWLSRNAVSVVGPDMSFEFMEGAFLTAQASRRGCPLVDLR